MNESFELFDFHFQRESNREQDALATFSSPTAKDLTGNPAIVVRASSSLSSYANRELEALATFSRGGSGHKKARPCERGQAQLKIPKWHAARESNP